jgi:alkylhydroperoxidase family enzyme
VCREIGIDEVTLAEIRRHSESDRFTPLEKAALDLATGMSRSPVEVDPRLRERLQAELTPGQLAELASAIAWENHRARLNRALGVGAMGFADGQFCVLPEPPPTAE